VTDHALIDPPPHSAADEAEHGGVHDPNLHHSPEEIKREVRVYLIVFGALAALTAVTVASFYALKSYPVHVAVMVALAIASVKGFLVAGYFMHLLSEKKLIYAVLLLTIFFFLVLIWGPWQHHYSTFNG
jgi:cytochrome c oxidase subunit IV